MHFFSTSAQIAQELGIDHNMVVASAENLPLSEEFKSANIQKFDLPIPGSDSVVTLVQLTEPGFNAVVFNLRTTDIPDSGTQSKIQRFREALFSNKSPALTAPAASAAPPQSQNTGGTTRTVIDEATRRKAEEMITSGQLDMLMAGTFADVHRKLQADLKNDPGYQNVRAYMINRRAQLNIQVG